MIGAKWKSIMEHIANKHDNHPYPLFKKCAHEEIDNRRWIRIGSVFKHVFLFFLYSGDFSKHTHPIHILYTQTKQNKNSLE